MIDYEENKEYIDSLFIRYPKIPKIILNRSLDRLDNFVELFDALENFPYKYPVIWDRYNKNWIYTTDLTQVKSFEGSIL